MPGFAEAGVRSLTDILAIDSDVGEHDHFRVLREPCSGLWTYFELAKSLREGFLLLRRQVLATEQKNLVVQPPLADFCNRLVGMVVGDVDADDFGSECFAKRSEFNRHDQPPTP